MLTLLKNRYLLSAAGGLLVVGVALFYSKLQTDRISELDKTIKELRIDITNKEVAVNNLEENIEQIRSTINRNIELKDELNKFKADIRKDINTRLKIFEEHNLKNLSTEKPKLIESRVNKATRKVFEEIEKESQDFYKETVE